MEGGGTVDARTADQLVPFMALADGPSCFTVGRISGHLASQMGLLPQFLPVAFNVEGGPPYRVELTRT
jgi:RNA 3'-terminal phosphate cyclase